MNSIRFVLFVALASTVALGACGTKKSPSKTPTSSEDSAARCSDGADNDGDDLIDCADPSCAPFCGSGLSETNCNDGSDDDGDGLVDCEDPDCGALQGCGPENNDVFCNDGRDNDADGSIDCQDSECQNSPEVDYCNVPETTDDLCRDRIDNDLDGDVDCLDSDCAGTSPCGTTETEDDAIKCADAADNDADGYTDCADFDCYGITTANGTCEDEAGDIYCADGFDNDANGFTDCADADCAAAAPCQTTTAEDTAALCNNGIDDDGDARIDCADDSCRNSADVDFCGPENSAVYCDDGIDNDGDEDVDCDDADCAALPVCAPVDLEDDATECADTTDNDSDGAVDCADTDCAAQPFCSAEDTDATCDDGYDNDGDGDFDCTDTDCAAALPCTSGPEQDPDCADGVDNDGDNLTDCADDGCYGVTTTLGYCIDPTAGETESGDTYCDDSFDNDGDGDVDCADPDCASAPVCTGPTAEVCDNTTDDDGDGFIDCADFDCLLDFTTSTCDDGLTVNDLQDATNNAVFPAANRGDLVNDPVQLRDVVILYVDPGFDRVMYVADQTAVTGTYEAISIFIPFTAPDPASPADGGGPLAAGDTVNIAGLFTEFVGVSEVLAYGWERTAAGTGLMPTALNPTVDELVAPLPVEEQANDRYEENATTLEVIDPIDDTLVAERYECGLVTLSGLQITDAMDEDGDGTNDLYEVGPAPDTSGSPRFLVGTAFAFPTDAFAIGQPIDSVTGIMDYYRRKVGANFVQQYRLEPRADTDWVYSVFVDTDGDGLSDSDEATLGTDPNDPDTDRDYALDGDETPSPLLGTADPANDTDGDGVLNALDSFLLDRDGDEIPDELDAESYDDPSADRDLDGVPNDTDPDDDNDGFCDPGVPENTTGPGTIDSDGDGVADPCVYASGEPDNCPYAPESIAGWLPLQANSDANGDGFGDTGWGDLYTGAVYGDACDWDADGDYWPWYFDNCPLAWNFDQTDTDGDFFGDACPDDAVPETPLNCTLTGNGGFYQCDLIIEEVLYNLSTSAPAGVVDANRDGTADINQDELIEIRNVSGVTLDLSGLEIWDTNSAGDNWIVRHVFPADTYLLHGQRIVVFGGSALVAPETLQDRFPASIDDGVAAVQAASEGSLGLNNSGGDHIYLMQPGAPAGMPGVNYIVADLAFGGTDEPSSGRNISVTRYPGGMDIWMEHPVRTDYTSGALRSTSPGRAPDNQFQ